MKSLGIIVMTLLACLGLAQYRAEVLELLKSKDWEAALVRITTEKARLTSDIIESLKHENPVVRSRAAHAIRVIDSFEQEARSSSDNGLGAARTAAVKALSIAAKDDDPKVKKESIWALAYLLRNREFGHHGEPWSSPKEVQPIIELGKEATGPLVQLLAFEDPNDQALFSVKIAAVRALVAIKDPASVEGLIALVGKAEHFLLSEAMDALTTFDDPRIVRVLIDRMDSKIMSYGTHRESGPCVG